MGAANTVPVNKAWDENFFMIKIQSDFPDAITIIGLPPTSDILRFEFRSMTEKIVFPEEPENKFNIFVNDFLTLTLSAWSSRGHWVLKSIL